MLTEAPALPIAAPYIRPIAPPARIHTLPEWVSQAICYEVPVPVFADSDGDGVGDLPGLAGRLDYLDWLGVDCLWLTGTRGEDAELADLLAAAHGRGLRVVADLPRGAATDPVRTVGRWLDLGLDGVRVATGLIPADVIRRCRALVADRSPDAALLPARPRSQVLPMILRALRAESARCLEPLVLPDGGSQCLRARRPAPLVGNDRNRVKLAAALLLSLPGIPVLYYGDEIGMTGQDGRPTPMQWSGGRNAGFSAGPAELIRPALVDDVVYGYRALNVESQRANRSSLLHWLRQLVARRRANPALAHDRAIPLPCSNPRVLGYLRPGGRSCDIACVYSLSPVPQPVTLDLSAYRGVVPVELTGGTRFPRIGPGSYSLTLRGYGFYWLCLQHPEETTAAEPVAEQPSRRPRR